MDTEDPFDALEKLLNKDNDADEEAGAELPADYFAAVAVVIEAARKVRDCKKLFDEAQEFAQQRFSEQRKAERALDRALENLQKVNVRRAPDESKQ